MHFVIVEFRSSEKELELSKSSTQTSSFPSSSPSLLKSSRPSMIPPVELSSQPSSLLSQFVPCYTGIVSVSITRYDYSKVTSLDIWDDADNIIASGGPFGASEIVFADGFYTFSIHDILGDGICCANGNGSYTFQVCSEVIKTGGNFGSQESTVFGICSTSSPSGRPSSIPSSSPSFSPSSSPRFIVEKSINDSSFNNMLKMNSRK